MPPLVSVIIPTYNEESHVRNCVESLFRQTYQPLEIIVGDDGSRDRTTDVVAAMPVSLLRFAHRGKAPTVNEAVREANGEIVVFADADLLYDERYVEALVGPIVAGEGQGNSHGTEYVGETDNRGARSLPGLSVSPSERRFRRSEADN